MKISEKLPQFENKKSLLIVTGKQDAVFYNGENGEIKELDSFKIDKPQYSDNEGFFMTRSGGETINSGAVREDKQGIERKLIDDFLTSYQEKIKDLTNDDDFSHLYLFSPDYLVREVKDALPAALLKKVEETFTGNYVKSHPFDLLKKIQKVREDKKVTPTGEEASKILHKGEYDENKS